MMINEVLTAKMLLTGILQPVFLMDATLTLLLACRPGHAWDLQVAQPLPAW